MVLTEYLGGDGVSYTKFKRDACSGSLTIQVRVLTIMEKANQVMLLRTGAEARAKMAVNRNLGEKGQGLKLATIVGVEITYSKQCPSEEANNA